MGLTYHFKFRAPASTTAATLEDFLRSIEPEAKLMGFERTTVMNGNFDTPQRRMFSRRLTTGLFVEHPNLKCPLLPEPLGIWFHDSKSGTCRVAPESGVLLILAGERGEETAFGFFRYLSTIHDLLGRPVAATASDEAWVFSEFLKTPDPRYRKIVTRFSRAGFLDFEQDDFEVRCDPSRP